MPLLQCAAVGRAFALGGEGAATPAPPRAGRTAAPHPFAVPLCGFPFWRGEARFLDAVTPTYSAAARRGLALLEAESEKPGETQDEPNH
jgi:hypothetical protein